MRLKLASLLLCLLFLTGLPITQAQDETPSPTPTPTTEAEAPRYIAVWFSETVFPEGVAFRMEAVLPGNVSATRVNLTIQSSAGEVEIPLDIEDSNAVVVDGPIVRASAFWLIDDSRSAPRVFEEISYQWELELSDGFVDVLNETHIFQDESVTWAMNVPEDSQVPVEVVVPADVIAPERVIEAVQPPYLRLSEDTAPITDPLQIILYMDPYTIACDTDNTGFAFVTHPYTGDPLPCDDEKALAIYARSGYIPYDLSSSRIAAARQVIVDDLVLASYASFWRGRSVPQWYRAGVQRLYADPNAKIILLSPALAASRANQLFSLDELDTVPSEEAREYEVWQAQSYGMVIYMADRFGIDTVIELATTARDYDSFANAYDELTGEPIDSLIPSWEVWMFSDTAPSAYSVDLYGPPTSTPTRIPSETPVPPTRTPFPTQTPTDTPTITNTPLPPTATPTVTPRAARDVFTPTPTPSPTPEPSGVQLPIDTNNARFIFLGMIVASVLIIIVALIFGRRRS